MMDRPWLLVGVIIGAVLLVLVGIALLLGANSFVSVGYTVLVAVILIACPLAIVGGAFWLARRILRGTGSGGYY
jgi:hypothetical protein